MSHLRYLNPNNFNKEITLEFNLGPQHLLEGLAEEVLSRRKKEFIYRANEVGRLSSNPNRLADPLLGSSIKTFRLNQSDKSKFPEDFWK